MRKNVLLFVAMFDIAMCNACGGTGATNPGGGGGTQQGTTHFSITAPGSANVGTAFNVTVTALDASDTTVASYSGTVHFTSTDPQAVLPADSTLTSGTGTFPVTLATAGNQTVTATDTTTASITGTSNSISATATAQTTHFSVGAPASASVGAPFNVNVTALDASNNTVTTYAGTFQFTSSDPQAVLPGDSTLANGVGTFAVTLRTSGTQTVTATDTSTASITGTSDSITVSGAAQATHFSVTAPANATAATAFDLTVTALDASNNVVTDFADSISFTSTDGQADLPPTSTLTNGTATFPAALRSTGSQTITATDAVTASITGTSNSINVSASSAANPVPLINEPLSPDAAAPGGPALTLTVNGTGFVSGSVVRWNGSTRATTVVSGSQLTATVLATDVANFNTASVTVFNPGPGGGTSNAVFFETTRPTSSVALGTPLQLATGQGPVSTATGDFNGDGKLDLVVTNSGSENVSVLLGKGDGTFQPAVNYNAGSGPESIAVGDFNGDGKLDLAVANSGSNNVSVLLGNGNGTFQPAVNYDVGSQPQFIALGDFNADGKLDLVVANTSSNNVSVLLGNGDGTFQAALSFDVQDFPVSVAVGDFNGDGKLDLAVVSIGLSNVNVLLGNGDGTFQPARNYAAGVVPISLVAADFNGDGKLDLAVANLAEGNSGPGSVSVLLGNGDGTFQPLVSYSVGSNTDSASIAVGDFNGDGKLDLVVASGGTTLNDNIGVLLGNGDGTFQPVVNYGAGSNPYVAVGDFNSDGRLDLAVVDPAGSALDILLQPSLVTGLSAFLAPDSLTFATQLLNTSSASQPVLLSNYGTTALTIASIEASTNFSETNTCGSSLAAGASCTIDVTFAPAATGKLVGTISVTDNAPGSPQSVSLAGLSTSVELTPTDLRFGCAFIVKSGCVCNELGHATLTNVATTPLDISKITITGPFSETNTCPSSLAAGNSCSISVRWSRTTGTGVLSVFDNADGSPQTIPVSGFRSCNPASSAAAATDPNSAASTCAGIADTTRLSLGEESR